MKVSQRTDRDDIARAAWLHFVGGLTQGQVASHLNVTNIRAHRLIARAQADGLVHVHVDARASECVELEKKLMDGYGLSFCQVGMTVPESEQLPLRTLAAIGSNYLIEIASGQKHQVIGLGHGRTLTSSVNAIGHCQVKNTKFVSVLGGLTRSFSANPYDVIFLIAQKTGAESHLLPTPLFVNSSADKDVLMRQAGITDTMSLIKEASLVVLGIGNLCPVENSSMMYAMKNQNLVLKLKEKGAVAEILGQFFDAEGNHLSTEYDGRVMAPPIEDFSDKEVTAIAGGQDKVAAINAALLSGFLTGLLTDESTALKLVEQHL